MFEIVLFTDLAGQIYHNKPAGAYSLASTLRRAGFSVMVVDHFQRYLRDKKKLVAALKKLIGPDTLFVGFSSTFFTGALPGDIPIDNWLAFNGSENATFPMSDVLLLNLVIKAIKQINPKIKIVYGGIKASKNDLLTSGASLDYIVHGYAETSAVALAQHLKHGTELKTKSHGPYQLLDYNTLAPEYNFGQHITRYEPHDLLLPGETLAVETSRGCMYNCTFCDFPLRNRKRDNFDYHISDNNLREYFVRNYELAGVTNYMLTDDTFNETTDKLRRFRDIVVSTGLPLRFTCFIRIDLFEKYPEQIQLLREAGVISIWIGLESLTAESNRAVGKFYSKELLQRQLENIKQQTGPDFRIYASFIVGLPHDTPELVNDWLNWAIDNPNLDCIQLSALSANSDSTPWPSEISTNLDKFGYIKQENGAWQNAVWKAEDAHKLAMSLQEKLWIMGRNRPAAFHLFGIMSLGYSFDEIRSLSIDQLPFDDMIARNQEQFEMYHSKLMAI